MRAGVVGWEGRVCVSGRGGTRSEEDVGNRRDMREDNEGTETAWRRGMRENGRER